MMDDLKIDELSHDADSRFGFAALIGAPNAGKSTLINQLTGAKVSIVTHKVQTTRSPVRAVFVHGASQVVLVDTPGIFEPKKKLEKAMVTAAWGQADEVDLVALLIDVKKGIREEEEAILDRLADLPAVLPKVLVLNKVDLVSPEALLPLTKEANERVAFSNTFMVSALTGNGVDALRDGLAAVMPTGPWHFPEDHLTDVPLRLMAAEITREKCFLRLHQELPYQLTVETESWKNQKNGSVRIEQTIYVQRESQRKILLGKGGQTIKTIGADARAEIAEIAEVPVHLFLFVKVREKWTDDPERYRQMGLELPK